MNILPVPQPLPTPKPKRGRKPKPREPYVFIIKTDPITLSFD